jgi:hypothetical protein
MAPSSIGYLNKSLGIPVLNPCPSRLERRLSDGDVILIVQIQHAAGSKTADGGHHFGGRMPSDSPRASTPHGRVRYEQKNEVQEDRT